MKHTFDDPLTALCRKGAIILYMPHFQGEAFVQNLERVEQVRRIAEAKQAEVAHVVLAWYLTRDSIDALIPGAKRAEQVLSNLKTLDVRLTEEEVQEIDRIFADRK